eukprot:TRINITY_DN557_c0_g1_i8.p1 TRINITY_DN557_c0_g1~~TRINITY_DN557_c0_g1_i8.p1  ORF type:complete len:458 (+),score=64.52 TRINITY_DN557_c0_g1_i8:147-1520(+)
MCIRDRLREKERQLRAEKNTLLTGNAQGAQDAPQEVWTRAKACLASLMTCEPTKLEHGMKVLCNVKLLEIDGSIDIILRSVNEPLFNACIDQASNGRHVCIVGSPGIGKSTTMLYLVRLLLKLGYTVVFRRRTQDRTSWYYEFKPDGNHYEVSGIFPEQDGQGKEVTPDRITSLMAGGFYVVDPGTTQDNCDVSPTIKRMIMDASGKIDHWGEDFTKSQAYFDYLGGKLLYLGLWLPDELVTARPYISSSLDDAEVVRLFGIFGGVPRAIFDSDWKQSVVSLKGAIAELTPDEAMKIATGQEIDLNAFHSDKQPRSWIVGYQSTAPFDDYKAVLKSEFVRQEVCYIFRHQLWTHMMRETKPGPCGYKFEAYVRRLMLVTSEYECRHLLGVRTRKNWEKAGALPRCSLGGCKDIRLVVDPVACAQDEERVVFHSSSDVHELIDFIYRVGNTYLSLIHI